MAYIQLYSSSGAFYLQAMNGVTWDGTIEYYGRSTSYWGTPSWITWDGSKIPSIVVNVDGVSKYRILLRGTNNTVINSFQSGQNGRWEISGNPNTIIASGKLESLFDYTSVDNNEHPTTGVCAYLFYNQTKLVNSELEFPSTQIPNYAFYNMFANTNIYSTYDLPATTIGNYSYSRMFYNTPLSMAPIISATTVGEGSFTSMFDGCTSLIKPPELPATTLADYCYSYMFYGCTSLTKPPELPATTLAESCYASMFYGCTSLTSMPELPATTLAGRCYEYMFYECTSLTIPSELPANELAEWCYEYMFAGCTSLISTPELPAITLAEGCYYRMFGGCTSLQIILDLPAITLADYCYYGMFIGCTSLKVPPKLPATTLTKECYEYMFRESGIEISATQTGIFQYPYIIPFEETGTVGTDSLKDMFYDCGVNTPTINTTYYLKYPILDYKTTASELTSIANAIRNSSDKDISLNFPVDYIVEINQLGGQVYYTGSFFPPNNLGEDGEIYVKIGV